MAATLIKEIENYCSQTRLLQKELKDTKEIFEDVNSAKFGVLRSYSTSIFYTTSNGGGDGPEQDADVGQRSPELPYSRSNNQTLQDSWQQNSCEGQPVIAEMTSAEETEIENVACRPPCFVIFGQTTHAKTMIVNQLFEREILPPVSPDETVRWKTIFFKYGPKNRIEPVIQRDYVVLFSPESKKHRKTWKIVPKDDLEMHLTDDSTSAVEVYFNHPLLNAGARVTVATTLDDSVSYQTVYELCTHGVNDVLVYAISENALNEKEIDHLRFIKSKTPNVSIFFVRVSSTRVVYGLPMNPDGMGSKSTKNHNDNKTNETLVKSPSSSSSSAANNKTGDDAALTKVSSFSSRSNYLPDQLADLGFICNIPTFDYHDHQVSDLDTDSDSYSAESELVENFDNFWSFVVFARGVLQRHLLSAVALMNVVHVRCLDMMISTAYTMAREVLCTPTRLKFAREKESELYSSLMEMTVKKQDEIKQLIADTITNKQDDMIEIAAEYQFKDITIPESGEITSAKDLKICTEQIQDLVLSYLNKSISGKLVGSVDILRESYTGVLTRCLASLEQQDFEDMDQMTRSPTSEPVEPSRTSIVLRDIVNAAYQVEIPLVASASFMKNLIEKMKQLMHSVLWRPAPNVNGDWKKKVAMNMLATVSDAKCQRLAKSICTQIRERLKSSHHKFEMLLKQLEMRTSQRLEKTEAKRLKVRKYYAPRVARLSLESRSLKDFILYGKPKQGFEIGRGQYGVVYSCDNWGNSGPCAIKSVVPPDDKHWNDLATEFHYTKNVPEHERIVALRGSVIDYTYNGGTGAAVLLIMDRLKHDLYTAIERKLPWLNRLVVAIDVVEGIRFLHSQGLVHRDVKLKNVLLDDDNRGKLTDLGFCKPEAMMSGSIVGTPIHMAPELFSGRYDHSVDVYAFGILFWYVCAGSIRLPCQFNKCVSKEMLWTRVKGGTRPEMPYRCDTECWELMQRCWNQDPFERPLVGEVETTLRGIHARFESSERAMQRSPTLPVTTSTAPVKNSTQNDIVTNDNDDVDSFDDDESVTDDDS